MSAVTSEAATAEKGEQTDCSAVGCCAEKLKRDLRLKKGNNVRRQLSKEGATAAPSSVQNGAVSLENGDHGEEKGESGEPEKASSQVGGDRSLHN